MRRAILVLALVIAGCAPTRPPCVIEPLPQGAPFLWRVEKDGGPVVWLYGTVHNGGADRVPDAAWTALAGSARFVSELGDLEPDPERFRALVKLPHGTEGLDFQLPQDDWWDLVDVLRGTIKPDDLRRVRPWYAMTLITRKVAPAPSPTMDVALARRARERGLPVDHLETWDEQLPLIGAAVGIADLQEALHARATMRCDLDRLRASYDAGDAGRMALHLDVAGSGALLTERNARWLAVIERHLAGGGAFVAVGLGHLLGDGGLPAQLAARGYSVERATTALP